MNRYIGALLFSVIISLVTLCDAVAEPPLKIGAIASLTGDASKDGLNWLEGAKLAAKELSSKGRDVELVVEDDRTNPAKVAAAFIKLATVDKVQAIVGGTWDFLAEPAYPLARQHKVPFITATNPIEIFSPEARENPWVFTNGLNLSAERVAIEKFIDAKKIRTAALLYINVPYGTMHGALLREIAQQKGIQIVSDIEYDYTGFMQDFRLTALKASQLKPDIVFIVTGYDGADLFLRELERVKAPSAVLMTHCLEAAYRFGGAPERYKNAYGIFSKLSSKEFETAFEKEYGRAPYDYAPLGYDAVRFIAAVAEALPGRSIESLEVRYDGATGEHRIPSSSRSVSSGAAAIMQIVGGKLTEFPLE